MSDGPVDGNEQAAKGRHAAREHDEAGGPGGTAPSAGQTEGGRAPAQQESARTGYAPTDTGGVAHAGAGEGGHPAGMAASGTQRQGGGVDDEGRHHTGWGPADGEVNDVEDPERTAD